MSHTKALAVASTFMTGLVAEDAMSRSGRPFDRHGFRLWVLDTIAELLKPSTICRCAVKNADPMNMVSWYATEDML